MTDEGRGQRSLEVRDVTIERGGAPVVHDASAVVGPGRALSLLGPSGAGKSSLLLGIAGLAPVASGTVRVGGRDVTGTPAHERSVGMVFQEYALFPHLDVLANVAYGLRVRGDARGDAARTAGEWLERVGLPPATYAERPVVTLSGGQRQRVALARALAVDPDVLLLDEPFGALDRQLREELLGWLAGFVRRPGGPAVVLVTHDRDEAFTLGDEVAVMRDGRIVQLDQPASLLARPVDAWTARFVGHDCVLDAAQAARHASLLGAVTGPVAVPAEAVDVVPRDEGWTVRELRWRGGERLARVADDDVELTARVPASLALALGDRVGVTVDRERLVQL